MSQPTTPIEHPLVRAVEGVAECLDKAATANPVFLTTTQKEQVLTSLAREKARLEALEHRVLAAADDVAVEHGTRHAGAWLAHATRQDAPAGRRAQRLAEGLDRRWLVLAEAYADGRASTAQVQVVGRALDDLPDDLDPDLRLADPSVVEVRAKRASKPPQVRRAGTTVVTALRTSPGFDAPVATSQARSRGLLNLAEPTRRARTSRAAARLTPSSTPSPHPAATGAPHRTTAGPTPPASPTPSRPCWSGSRPTGCPSTAAPPPR